MGGADKQTDRKVISLAYIFYLERKEDINGVSGSMKSGEFRHQLSDWQLLK
jgi:hypothetical protein